MKRKCLATGMVMMLTASMGIVGCGSNGGDSKEASASGGKDLQNAYYTYTDMKTAESGESNVAYGTDSTFYVYSDGTYMLTQKQTMDITEASAGYLKYVGYMKVSTGKCTLNDEDGESAYDLEKPDRVIYSNYMMTGPVDTVEIYVDSADEETYDNYSPSDISGKSAEEVVDILLNTNYDGSVTEGEAVYTNTIVVNNDNFMIEEMQ